LRTVDPEGAEVSLVSISLKQKSRFFPGIGLGLGEDGEGLILRVEMKSYL